MAHTRKDAVPTVVPEITLRLMTEADLGMLHEWLANAADLNKGLGTALVRALVGHLVSDPAVTRIQTDPSPDNHRAIRCYEKAGFVQHGVITTPDGPAMYMVQTCEAYEAARLVAAREPSSK